MSDGDIVGDGEFQGVITPCDVCLQLGEVVTLAPPRLVTEDCPRCDGTRHVHIRCREDEVGQVIAALPLTRQQVELHAHLRKAGLCVACFGSGRLAQIATDEEGVPVDYVEADCPRCVRPA